MGECARRELTPSLVPVAQVCALLRCTIALAGVGAAGVGTGSSAAAATSKKLTAASWDSAQQQLVLGDGVMSEAPGAGFAGAAP